MSEITESIQPMTRKEAEQADKDLRRNAAKQRIDLYIFHARTGAKALGYDNFEDYIEERLQIGRQTAYDAIQQVEVTRHALHMTFQDLYALRTNEKGDLLPQTITRELHKLPTAELRHQVYEEMLEIEGTSAVLPGRMSAQLKQRVKTVLGGLNPTPTPVEPTRPDPLEEAMQRPAAPAPKPAPTKPVAAKKPTVSTFTPDPDPEPVVAPTSQRDPLFQLNFRESKEALETALAWVENEQVDGEPKDLKFVLATLQEISCWIEAEL